MIDLIVLLAVVAAAYYIWTLNNINNQLRLYSKKLCAQQNVQWVSSALTKARPTMRLGMGIQWRTEYSVEFSSNGSNLFEMQLSAIGMKVINRAWPAFPEPQWPDGQPFQYQPPRGCRR